MELSTKIMDPAAAAQKAELLYVNDEGPGYVRRKRGKGFVYLAPEGGYVTDDGVILRLKNLRIPPAWEDVWICPKSNCHIQATGRDSRGRKQYIYHPEWNEVRTLAKFDRLIPFGDSLPGIRESVDRDLRRPAFSRETVLAFVVSLLEETLVRIGNTEYAHQNDSYGLTTLRDYHVRISGAVLQLRFRGKRGKFHEIDIRNRRLARLARKYQELPGQELLKYEDGTDEFKVIDSGDVNAYLKEISGSDFTAKDFRTWGGTVSAAAELYRMGPANSLTEGKRKISAAIKHTAGKLGNTATICRQYYVAPQIIDAYLDQTLFRVMSQVAAKNGNRFELSPEEKAVISLLQT